MSSSSNTNNTEVEMINPTENDLVTPEVQISGVLDTKTNWYFTNNLAAQSNEHAEPYILETANKATQPENTEWLHSEGFTSVVNKKSAVSKKNKKLKNQGYKKLNLDLLYTKKRKVVTLSVTKLGAPTFYGS
ncbi:27458_t:CDS:2 [Gigaspora margarita]|uniref:27458_t:CDS:1 n=1 Tax=Gigaspora margarita TaxID=4874 RepID=A0ABN7UK45_GIGMA|nr:27458_t:CDS:2 [Gigaspora margarita]